LSIPCFILLSQDSSERIPIPDAHLVIARLDLDDEPLDDDPDCLDILLRSRARVNQVSNIPFLMQYNALIFHRVYAQQDPRPKPGRLVVARSLEKRAWPPVLWVLHI
jgi:hypothetical protein